MSPEECIAALDNALETAGEDIILRRPSGAPAARVYIDVPVRAFIRSYRLRDVELVPNTAISQEELLVTISPTEIGAAQWPGGTSPQPGVDPSIPVKGDKLMIRGRERNVEVVDPMRVENVVVRIAMKASG